MSGTRSLGLLLLLSFVFCAGLALAASTAGISALAAPTREKLNPPTVLWNAYPLRQGHSTTQRESNDNKPSGNGTGKVSTTSPMRTRTGATDTRPTVVHGNRSASRPTSGRGGFPTVFVMTGVIGVLLASTLLLVAHAVPARAGGYRRNPGPVKTTSRPKHPPTGRLSPAKPAAPRTKPVSPPESHSVEQPPRTDPASAPPRKRVDENPATRSPPDERATTDDLLDALRPKIKPAEDLEKVSAPERVRPVKPVEAAPHLSAAARQAPPQRRTLQDDLFCEIRFWRGYVKCQLYVEVEGSRGAFVESSFFRLRDPMVPDDRAQRALADLLADLERSGWSVVETGPAWYRRRLRRSTPTP